MNDLARELVALRLLFEPWNTAPHGTAIWEPEASDPHADFKCAAIAKALATLDAGERVLAGSPAPIPDLGGLGYDEVDPALASDPEWRDFIELAVGCERVVRALNSPSKARHMTLVIRAAAPADIPANMAIQAVLFPEDKQHYAENVHYPNTLNFVAVLDGSIVGFTSALIDASDPRGNTFWRRARPYIAFVGVLPEHQHKGVGSKLLSAVCEAIFRSPWYLEALLECDRDQAAFYERHGFQEIDRTEVDRIWGANLAMRVPFRKRRSTP